MSALMIQGLLKFMCIFLWQKFGSLDKVRKGFPKFDVAAFAARRHVRQN